MWVKCEVVLVACSVPIAFLLTASQPGALSSPRLRAACFRPVFKVCCCYLLAYKNANKSRK